MWKPLARRETRYLRPRVLLSLAFVIGVLGAGTMGYAWLWWGVGGTWLDALFMTVITITTVGYGEVRPLDGPGRVFTMFVAVVGVGSLFYALGVLMEYLVTVRLADPGGRRRMEKQIDKLTGHVILAGLGRVGGQAALEIKEAGVPFVVVDPGRAAARKTEERGYPLASGDRLLALGTTDQLERLERLIAKGQARP